MEKNIINAADLFAVVNKAFVEACSAYVIRNNKRFNRYELNLTKDVKRIKYLLKRSYKRFPLVIKEIQDCIGVNGLTHEINLADMKIPASADFVEIIALLSYWGLWEYRKEIIALIPSTK